MAAERHGATAIPLHCNCRMQMRFVYVHAIRYDTMPTIQDQLYYFLVHANTLLRLQSGSTIMITGTFK